MIRIQNLNKRYGTKRALCDVSLTFPKAGFIAIVGPSGCGKTTLLNILSGIDDDYDGEVYFKQTELKSIQRQEKSRYRLANIGYVFQDFRLFELDTVNDNLLLSVDLITRDTQAIKKRYIANIIDLVGLSHKIDTKVNLLSGGEKQRVALARALVNDPSLILCDEPTGALDEVNAKIIMTMLAAMATKRLVILVTHDEELANAYCDRKIRMVDGRVVENQALSKKNYKKQIIIGKSSKSEQHFPMPIKTMLRRAFSIWKTRKYRLIINNTMMSMGLLGIGLSLIMSFSIDKRVVSGLSSIVNDRMIIMSNNYQGSGTIKGYSASYENVNKIKDTYANYINGIGVSYAVNFESFFQDRDELFISSTPYKIIMPRFSSRQINDFLWLDSPGQNYRVYPRQLSAIEDDAMVVGLTYNEMIGVCYSLRIERNFESLGAYIKSNRPLLTLGLANNSWAYEDEQIFHLVGVVETNVPYIFHTNHLWSEYVFQEKMRLPSVDNGHYEFPWQMAKTYFVTTVQPIEIFLERVLLDKNLIDYVFEIAGQEHHPTLCQISGPCQSNRLLVFHVDSDRINVSKLPAIFKHEKRLKNFLFASDGGYYYHPDSFIAGFAKNLYLSLSEMQLEQAIDADNLIDEEMGNVTISPPRGVLQGSFVTSMLGGVNFSSDLSNVVLGSAPQNLSEVVVSEGLAKKLSFATEAIGKTLHVAVNYENIPYDNNRFEKHYSIVPLSIVGIAKGDHLALHHTPYWSVGFFQVKAGVSSFELIPKNVIFELKADTNVDEVIKNLSSKFGDFRFYNPVASIQEGIDETMGLLRVVLLAFSSLAIVTSLFLFFIVMFVTIEENRGDIVLMNYIGVAKKDIRNSFIVCGMMISSLSFTLSAIEIIIADFFINHVIGGYLGTNIPYVFNPGPLLAILSLSIVIAYIASYLAFEKHFSQGQKKKKS